MRHGVSGRKFDMPTGHRKALFRGLMRSLILHERITTTTPRAKEIRPMVEKLITLGKRGDVHARRLAMQRLPDKDVVERLFKEVAPKYADRPGGYTRITKVGKRLGDGAEMAVIELV